jgi:membrane-associated protein
MSDVLQFLSGLSATHAYLLLFAGVMLENAGIPLPGETALLAAAYLSSAAGGAHLHIWLVIVSAFAGAILGDNLGYWAGRTFARKRLTAGKRFLFLTPERFAKVETYFEKYGALTVFFGRFVALLRIAAGPAAGAAGMPWWRFLLANAAGAALWAAVIGGLGYAAGPAWEELHRWLGRGAWVIAGLVVLSVIAWHAVPYLRRRLSPSPPSPDSQKPTTSTASR